MVNTERKRFIGALMAVALIGGSSTAATAGDRSSDTEADGDTRARFKTRSGWYLAGGFASAEVGGDFDGQAFVAGGGSLEILPDVGGGSGVKLGFGYQARSVDLEVNWVKSDADGDWLGETFSTEFNAVNFDGRYYWLNRIRPFVALGFGFNRLKVDDGSTDGSSTEAAKFNQAVSLRGGAGVQFQLIPSTSIHVEAMYRKMEFSHVDGVVSGSLEGSEVDGSGTTLSITARYVFGR